MARTKDREQTHSNGTPAPDGDQPAKPDGRPCAITRGQWAGFPDTLVVKVGESAVVAAKKAFASGGFGYYVNEKVTLVGPDGTAVKLQANLCLTVVNSKNLPAG